MFGIIKFFEKHSIPEDFDLNFYKESNLDLSDFYQPFCSENNISERHRLYYHFFYHGIKSFHSQESALLNFSGPDYTIDKSRILKLFKNTPSFKVSYCICSYNRLNFLKKTLPHNLNKLQKDEQIVLSDFSQSKDIDVYIFDNFQQYLRSNQLKFIKVSGQNYFHASIYKNISHYYADGEYVYNIDSDNFLSNHRNLLDEQISISEKGFVIHNYLKDSSSSSRGSFGSICVNKEDFLSIGGYDESFMPISYQDTDILLRLKKLNFRYVQKALNQDPINHTQSIVFSSENSFYSWEDCLKYNKKLSAYNLSKNRFCATNIKKKFFAKVNFNQDLLIAHSNINQTHISKFNISKQINPTEGKDLCEVFINADFDSHTDLTDFYLKNISNKLLYEDPDTIKSVSEKLKNNIINHSIKNCNIYKNFSKDKIYTKSDFDNHKEWVSNSVADYNKMVQTTNGSSTGNKFQFFNYKKYFHYVQNKFEFDLIRDEFEINNSNNKILVLINWPLTPKGFEEFYTKKFNFQTGNKFNNFNSINAITYFVNFQGYNDYDNWYKKLLDFLADNYFDIVISSGPIINLLTKYIKKHNFNHKFTNLLSHTTEFPRMEDFKFLKNNENINNFCDHMRCWDGGATFFTCKHGTYHINDAASWSFEGEDNKLISTDYFNFTSPFINYWNGDSCNISNDYKRCRCGRYYRPFKMLQSRPFLAKGGKTIKNIKEKVLGLSFNKKISQVEFLNFQVSLHCDQDLNKEERLIIEEIFTDYHVIYIL
ncbi:hypothetical protein OAA62_01015 [bacterium]|nr:hypothetical protein [bacterium]